ncbi:MULTISPECIES: hypothetical protein [unclassified Streptomyces]|nr:hypothetical protein [Streptomyces sp. 13-12-16]
MALSGDPVGEIVMLFHASLLTVVEASAEQGCRRSPRGRPTAASATTWPS